MGHDLKNSKGGYRRFGVDSWWCMQDLAKRHGWKPQGTVLNTDIQYQLRGGNLDDPEINQELWREAENDVKSWPGSYATNDFQWVTEEDARNMADALEKAVEELEEGR